MLALPLLIVSLAGADHRLDQLKTFLEFNAFPNTPGHNISLIIGDADGEILSYANGHMKLDTPQLLGSGSKWAASTALLSMIATANASLDDPISKYLSWWTTVSPSLPICYHCLRHRHPNRRPLQRRETGQR